MRASEFREMSQERKGAPDLAALRINREPVRSSGPRGWMLLAAVLVVAAGAAAYFFGGRSLRPRTVETVTASIVTEGQATTLLTATGYVEAERKADLSPKITSRITELNVTEGSRVRKGDVIARLDDTDLNAQLAEADANWINAKAELARQESLFREGVGPRSALDAAVATERATRARVDYIRALIDYTVIRAPFLGVITAKRAFVGEAVSPVRILSLRRRLGRRHRDARRVLQPLRGGGRQRGEPGQARLRSSPRRSRSTRCPTRPTTGSCGRSCRPRTGRRPPCA